MSVNDIFRRVNLQVLATYVASGRVVVDASDSRSYDDRLAETQESINKSIQLLIQTQGKQALLMESIEQYSDVRFEIGFKAGLMLVTEIMANHNC